jgi:transcriptional regulator with XRE-family HTH domain
MSTESQKQFFRAWRQFRGLSLDDVAARAGGTKSEWGKIERGDTRWHRDHLHRLAEALSVEVWWLVSIDPFDTRSQLRVLSALARVPADRLDAAVRMLEALSNGDHSNVMEPATLAKPGRKPKKRAPQPDEQ